MPLPSQSARPVSRHNHMFRRSRKRRGPLATLVVLLIVVGGFGIWTVNGPGDGDADDINRADAGRDAESAASTFQDLPLSAGLGSRPVSDPPSGGSPDRASARPPSIATPPARQPQPQSAVVMGQSSPASSPSTTTRETPAEREDDPTSATKPTADRHASSVPRTTPPASNPTSNRQPSNPAEARTLQRVQLGEKQLAANQPIDARRTLTMALESGNLDATTARQVRRMLGELNDRLVFSPEIVIGDQFSFAYTIRPGDSLVRIANQQGVAVDWRLIQRINRIPRPEQIRAGQTIKLVTGPFHAVVSKEDFRLDLYLGEGTDRVFVRSFRVGLGEYNSTPEGLFRVRMNSKLINPEWTNPRTGERFLPDDPKNPIGEHWIGLEGVSDVVKDLGGYGVHGTIEPDSIGRQASMGCVRLLAEDIAVLYECLAEDVSTVEIVAH